MGKIRKNVLIGCFLIVAVSWSMAPADKTGAAAQGDKMKGVKVENGVYVLESDAKLADLNLFPSNTQVASRFGWKMVTAKDEKNKEIQILVPGTEDDFRKAEARRLGVKAENVKIHTSEDLKAGCYNLGPPFFGCDGFCSPGICTRAWNPAGRYYYCVCR